MDKLIERELLAAEAERLGFVISDDEVERSDWRGQAHRPRLPAHRPRLTKDGKFNYDAFKNFVQYDLGLTPQGFIDEQKKELLAARVRDLLRGGVIVSTDEVKADYLRKNRR